MIESEMPYFGKAYSSIVYGGDTGMKFKGKPSEFTVIKGKKGFEVKAVVQGTSDRYILYLTVGFSGSSSLSISSNNRSSISYNGDIYATEKPAEKK